MKSWLTKKVESLAGRVGYETERLMLEINEQIITRLRDLKITRSALAEKVGKDRSQITRLLNGSANVTIKTLVEISSALGTRWNIELADHKSKWTSSNRQYFEVVDWLVYAPVTFNKPSTKQWASIEEAWRYYASHSHLNTSQNVMTGSPSKNILLKPELREVVN